MKNGTRHVTELLNTFNMGTEPDMSKTVKRAANFVKGMLCWTFEASGSISGRIDTQRMCVPKASCDARARKSLWKRLEQATCMAGDRLLECGHARVALAEAISDAPEQHRASARPMLSTTHWFLVQVWL